MIHSHWRRLHIKTDGRVCIVHGTLYTVSRRHQQVKRKMHKQTKRKANQQQYSEHARVA